MNTMVEDFIIECPDGERIRCPKATLCRYSATFGKHYSNVSMISTRIPTNIVRDAINYLMDPPCGFIRAHTIAPVIKFAQEHHMPEVEQECIELLKEFIRQRDWLNAAIAIHSVGAGKSRMISLKRISNRPSFIITQEIEEITWEHLHIYDDNILVAIAIDLYTFGHPVDRIREFLSETFNRMCEDDTIIDAYHYAFDGIIGELKSSTIIKFAQLIDNDRARHLFYKYVRDYIIEWHSLNDDVYKIGWPYDEHMLLLAAINNEDVDAQVEILMDKYGTSHPCGSADILDIILKKIKNDYWVLYVLSKAYNFCVRANNDHDLLRLVGNYCGPDKRLNVDNIPKYVIESQGKITYESVIAMLRAVNDFDFISEVSWRIISHKLVFE